MHACESRVNREWEIEKLTVRAFAFLFLFLLLLKLDAVMLMLDAGLGRPDSLSTYLHTCMHLELELAIE